jgi:hypothetical protein
MMGTLAECIEIDIGVSWTEGAMLPAAPAACTIRRRPHGRTDPPTPLPP